MAAPRFDVFLSHNSKDKTIVRELDERLHNEGGVRPWLGQMEIPAGEDWEPVINAALSACRGCIIFLGGAGWGRTFHPREAKVAFDRRGPSFKVVIVLLPGAACGRR